MSSAAPQNQNKANTNTNNNNNSSRPLFARAKSSLLSLDQLMHKRLVIECPDGRMVRALLKGFDSNMNLTLQDAVVLHEDATNPFSPQIGAAGVQQGAPGGGGGGAASSSSGNNNNNNNMNSGILHRDVCRILGSVVMRGNSVLAVYDADGASLIQ